MRSACCGRRRPAQTLAFMQTLADMEFVGIALAAAGLPIIAYHGALQLPPRRFQRLGLWSTFCKQSAGSAATASARSVFLHDSAYLAEHHSSTPSLLARAMAAFLTAPTTDNPPSLYFRTGMTPRTTTSLPSRFCPRYTSGQIQQEATGSRIDLQHRCPELDKRSFVLFS